MTLTTTAIEIEALWGRLHATMAELKGKESLRGTPWHADRVELAAATLGRIRDMEANG